MNQNVYFCPDCESPLVLFANGDEGPHDDRWTCEQCGIEYSHYQFPLPKGYVKAAKEGEKAQALDDQRYVEKTKLDNWNRWAKQ